MVTNDAYNNLVFLTNNMQSQQHFDLVNIIPIANYTFLHYDSKLDVSLKERESICIENDINSCKCVEITARTKQKTNYKSYAITSVIGGIEIKEKFMEITSFIQLYLFKLNRYCTHYIF